MSVTTADCELLGRGPVQGSADSDSLAALVRQLCKQQQRGRLPGQRCTVACSRDAGLEIIPYQRKRPDDEGFESDEDLASLGSYEDPNKRKTGMLAAVSAAGTGAGSDSANSSGVSEDSDDADAASLKEQDGVPAGSTVATAATDSTGGSGSRETYGLADVAFCHTDATALPGIAVWVIKTRRASVVGLEAIVIRSRDNKLQDVCRAYQEHSRRLKLEPKLWASQSNGAGPAQRRKVGGGNVILTATPEINRYNLVQRTDTDGVTHIEVTAGPVVAASVNNTCHSPDSRRANRDGPTSSIISISTPESPRAKVRASGEDEDEGSVGDEPPPQRPERRKYKTKSENGSDSGGGDDFRRQQKVVRGQFIRVNVNHSAVLPPSSPHSDRKLAVHREQPAVSKPTSTLPSGVAVPDRLWSTADYDRLDGRYEEHRRSSRSSSRTRSRSSGPSRRQLPLQLAPAVQPPPAQPLTGSSHSPPVAFSRYPNVVEQQQPSSFGNRFFGKLREITSGNQSPPPSQQDLQPVTFRRRNSVGESAAPNFYQYFSHNHHLHQQQYQQQQQLYLQQQQHNRQQSKNGGNLKSVIKKNNKSQPYQHAYDEPKKVTFSAYATVQVVD